MSAQELEAVIAAVSAGGPDLSGPPSEARTVFEEMMKDMPVAEGVRFERTQVGGLSALRSVSPGANEARTLIYLHGGAYVIGSAQAYRALSSNLAMAAGAAGLSVDYRLAPEHPFPAAVDDAVAAYRGLLDAGHSPGSIAVAGDSAGGGLTIAMLVAARRAGLPMPASALVISPWVDLECNAPSIAGKADEDPILDRKGLIDTAAQYLAGQPARSELASPIHADLTGLPPLLIQVGSAEILLDDATGLAARAGTAGVETRLEIWPKMPHVWHAFGFMLSEGRQALASAGAFLSGHFSA